MMNCRFTIGRLMMAIAAVAVEFGLLPILLALLAALPTLALSLGPASLRWRVVGLSVLGFAVTEWAVGVTTRCECTLSGQCANNLRQVSLALQMYSLDHGCYPPACVTDARGKPLYSWRVLILPYLEQRDLYNDLNLGEPWDGPHNLAFTSRPIRLFTCPHDPRSMGETNYLAITGPGTAFSSGRSSPSMILLAEVANARIHWAEPRDLDIRTMSPRLNDTNRIGISSADGKAPAIVFADSRLERLNASISPTTLKSMLTIGVGQLDR